MVQNKNSLPLLRLRKSNPVRNIFSGRSSNSRLYLSSSSRLSAFFIASPFIVSGASMEPIFDTGHYLIVDQITYRFENPVRGDVIVFRYPKDPSKFFIKRIIGLPGETVNIARGAVSIVNTEFPGGMLLSESYIAFPKYDTLSATR